MRPSFHSSCVFHGVDGHIYFTKKGDNFRHTLLPEEMTFPGCSGSLRMTQKTATVAPSSCGHLESAVFPPGAADRTVLLKARAGQGSPGRDQARMPGRGGPSRVDSEAETGLGRVQVFLLRGPPNSGERGRGKGGEQRGLAGCINSSS